VETALKEAIDLETGGSLLAMNRIRDVNVSEGTVSLTLGLTSWSRPIGSLIDSNIESLIRASHPGVKSVQIRHAEAEDHPAPLGTIGLTVKSVVVVGSGKGGVGKSTIAASLAIGLKRAGAKVGLMDADVYGPSIPHLLGVSGRPEVVNNKLTPANIGGMPVMSMGLLVAPGEAVVWRGPMLYGAITQFLRDTAWGELDYLIIDMPPGTGDIALTLSQMLPLAGAVVVCTPQDVALLDAVKAIAMFRKVNIPLLGMVENMSGFVCPDCGKRYDIFGSGGAKKRAQELNVPFLGDVPITIQIRTNGDAGRAGASFDDPACAPYLEHICQEMVRNLARGGSSQPPPKLPSL
jgi:ATP-binding protein involved in chromosome partitioning